MVSLLALTLALTLAACAPCPSFEETRIVADPGLSPESRFTIEQGLADMERWTGLDGVCVDRIEVVEDGETGDDAVGNWREGRRRIRLDAGMDPLSLERVTRHELCHALDDHLDLSSQAPGLFDGDDIDAEHYSSPALRRQEHFADSCAAGPLEYALTRELVQRCDLDTVVEPERAWLMDHVFLDPEPGAWAEAGVPLVLGETLQRQEWETQVWKGPVQAVGLAWTLGATEVVGPSGLVSALYLVASEPRTRQPLLRVDLPGLVHQPLNTVLVAGDDGLYVELEGQALRVDASGLVTVHAALTDPEVDEVPLAVHQGWLYYRVGAELLRRDLDSGAVQPLALDQQLDSQSDSPYDVQLSGDDLHWVDGFGLVINLDLSTQQALATTTTPGAWLYRAWPLGEGDWLGLVAAHVDLSTALAVYDAESASWRLPADPCGLVGDYWRDEVVDVDGALWVETADGVMRAIELQRP